VGGPGKKKGREGLAKTARPKKSKKGKYFFGIWATHDRKNSDPFSPNPPAPAPGPGFFGLGGPSEKGGALGSTGQGGEKRGGGGGGRSGGAGRGTLFWDPGNEGPRAGGSPGLSVGGGAGRPGGGKNPFQAPSFDGGGPGPRGGRGLPFGFQWGPGAGGWASGIRGEGELAVRSGPGGRVSYPEKGGGALAFFFWFSGGTPPPGTQGGGRGAGPGAGGGAFCSRGPHRGGGGEKKPAGGKTGPSKTEGICFLFRRVSELGGPTGGGRLLGARNGIRGGQKSGKGVRRAGETGKRRGGGGLKFFSLPAKPFSGGGGRGRGLFSGRLPIFRISSSNRGGGPKGRGLSPFGGMGEPGREKGSGFSHGGGGGGGPAPQGGGGGGAHGGGWGGRGGPRPVQRPERLQLGGTIPQGR